MFKCQLAYWLLAKGIKNSDALSKILLAYWLLAFLIAIFKGLVLESTGLLAFDKRIYQKIYNALTLTGLLAFSLNILQKNTHCSHTYWLIGF